MMKAISLALFITIILFGCSKSEQSETPIEFVRIEALLGNPILYDGKLVKIQGAAVVRFEGNFICPYATMIDSGSAKKCLWLTPGVIGNKGFNLSPLHGKFVELIGNFDSKSMGHFSAYGGSFLPIRGKILSSHERGNPPGPPPPSSSF